MRKNNIIIELTPLLDVILVILFFILVQSEGRIGILYAEAQDAIDTAIEEFMQDFVEEFESLEQSAADYTALRLGLEEDTSVIMVSVMVDEADRNVRSITIEAQGASSIIGLSWDGLARENASVLLNMVLADSIQNAGTAVVFVVFQYNSADIFAADHGLISMAIHNQRLDEPQVFTAEMDLRN